MHIYILSALLKLEHYTAIIEIMYWLKTRHVSSYRVQKYFRILIHATIWCEEILIYCEYYQLDKITMKTTSSYIVVIKIISICFLDWKRSLIYLVTLESLHLLDFFHTLFGLAPQSSRRRKQNKQCATIKQSSSVILRHWNLLLFLSLSDHLPAKSSIILPYLRKMPTTSPPRFSSLILGTTTLKHSLEVCRWCRWVHYSTSREQTVRWERKGKLKRIKMMR